MRQPLASRNYEAAVVSGPQRLPRWELCEFSMGIGSSYNVYCDHQDKLNKFYSLLNSILDNEHIIRYYISPQKLSLL